MANHSNYSGSNISVLSHQIDGPAILDLAKKFAGHVRRQYPEAKVEEAHGESLTVAVKGLEDQISKGVAAKLNAQGQVHRYLHRLLLKVGDLEAKFKIERHIQTELSSNYESLQFAYIFFRAVTSALGNDVVISLDKLYEKSKYLSSIYTFLKFLDDHADQLYQFETPLGRITKQSIEAQVRELDKSVGSRSMQHYRDSIAAHTANQYFYSVVRNISETEALLTEDVEGLIETAKRILANYYLVLNGENFNFDNSGVAG